MTDNEIIKALEEYVKENKFEYFHSNTIGEYPLIRKAFDLINRQQAEIERLNELLETRHKVFETKCEELEIAKAEAYKEFAERLKENINKRFVEDNTMIYRCVHIKDIDNLLKELVGEDND